MSINKDKRITNIKNLLNYRSEKEYSENLFSHLTHMGYWEDNKMMTDQERELFLYRDFFEYYNLLTIDGITGITEERQKWAINLIKNQLDIELHRVKNHIKREEV